LIVVILTLAESFDSFSLGKLFSMSRKVEEKKKDIAKLEKDKEQLLSQLISLSVSQSQNQTHTNVYGDYNATATVSKATGQEIAEKKTDELASQPVDPSPEPEATPIAAPVQEAKVREPRMRLNFSKVEDIAFRKYFGEQRLHTVEVIRDVKLSEKDQTFDPISTSNTVFDAYVADQHGEEFVEFRSVNISPMFRDRLYVMLSKILHYRMVKRIHAQLDLVLIRVPGEPERYGGPMRFLRDFAPAIDSGLLKIREIELSQEEANSCMEPWP
jgi:hypothetical protein